MNKYHQKLVNYHKHKIISSNHNKKAYNLQNNHLIQIKI